MSRMATAHALQPRVEGRLHTLVPLKVEISFESHRTIEDRVLVKQASKPWPRSMDDLERKGEPGHRRTHWFLDECRPFPGMTLEIGPDQPHFLQREALLYQEEGSALLLHAWGVVEEEAPEVVPVGRLTGLQEGQALVGPQDGSSGPGLDASAARGLLP